MVEKNGERIDEGNGSSVMKQLDGENGNEYLARMYRQGKAETGHGDPTRTARERIKGVYHRRENPEN